MSPDRTIVRGKCNFTYNCQELHSDIIRVACCISWKCKQIFMVVNIFLGSVCSLFCGGYRLLEEHTFGILLLVYQRTLAHYKSARCIWTVRGNAQSFLSESSVTCLCVRSVRTVLIISVQHECDCSDAARLSFILTVWCICTWNLCP